MFKNIQHTIVSNTLPFGKAWLGFFLLLSSCRQDVLLWPSEQEQKGIASSDSICGFYLLNEGNMGSNKCTLDYYDYQTATYTRNIYGNANPDVVKELGDVGNDLQIYGSRLWAVVNCSNKVDVMSADSCRRIGQIDIPNCRYIAFSGRYAYITSYAGPVQITTDYRQLGYVAKVDTATLQIVDTCLVGYQPDQISILDGYAYVCNSGGYMVPNYENTVSVINLSTFREERRIEVAINLQNILADKYGQLWVSSRGDYYDVSNSLYYIQQPGAEPVVHEMTGTDGSSISVSAMALSGDSLYFIGNQYSYVTHETTTTYGIINVRTHQMVSDNFITDGTDKAIVVPYGIAVNPRNHDILVGDARNYVNPGRLYCFSKDGIRKWDVRTGDIPAHIAFRWQK